MDANIRSLDPRELVDHARAMRQLARGIVRDAHTGEDAAQEAMLAALERPPRTLDSLAGWLKSVAVNFGRNSHRSAGRRLARERAVARAEAQPAGEEALERAETARMLAELVADLPEEQRTVVVLRYFEGLTPTAIARRLGAPVKTVKTRHTRALAALRARLDERSGGDRGVWLAALVPLTRWPLPAGALAVAAAVLAVGYAAFLLASNPPREEARGPLARAAVAESRVDGAPSPARPAREPAASASAPVSARAVRLSGSVLGAETGAPLAGVTVVAAAARTDGPRELFETRSAADGAFAFEWPGPVVLLTLEARPTATTIATRLAPGTTLDSEHELELRVESGATLAGTVVGPDGAPLAGASVRAWCAERAEGPGDRATTSDAAGRFRLEHLGPEFRVLAEAPGLVCAEGLRGRLVSGARGEGLEIRMATPHAFRGRVVDESGRGVEGARLEYGFGDSVSSRDATAVNGVLRWQPSRMEAVTGPSGAFELGPWPHAHSGARVTHPAHLWQDFELHEGEDAELVLRAGHALTGRVVDTIGAPVADATVWIGNGPQARTTTGADGRFELRPLEEAENAFVVVHAKGHALHAVQPVRIGRGTASLELRLQPARALAGRVVDVGGRPLAGAAVRLEGERLLVYDGTSHDERETWEWFAGIERTRTDADGRFRFDDLPDGEFGLRVQPAHAPELTASFTGRAGREDLELVVDAAALEGVVLAGRVTDARTGAPLEAFELAVSRPDGLGRVHRFETAPDGRFRRAGFEPGRYALEVRATGYARWTRPLADLAAGATELDVALVPSCALELVMARTLQRRVSTDASVRFQELDGTPLRVDLGTSGSVSHVQVGYEPTPVHGLPRKPVRLVANTLGGREIVLELDLTVPPTEPVVLAFEPDLEVLDAELDLGVFLTTRSDLAGGLVPEEDVSLEELRAALEAGELEPPSVPVELEFLDARDRVLCRATLAASGRGTWRWTLDPAPDEDEASGDEPDPSLSVRIPANVRTVVARAAGCRVERADLALDPGRTAVVLLSLLREPR